MQPARFTFTEPSEAVKKNLYKGVPQVDLSSIHDVMDNFHAPPANAVSSVVEAEATPAIWSEKDRPLAWYRPDQVATVSGVHTMAKGGWAPLTKYDKAADAKEVLKRQQKPVRFLE